MIHNPGLLMASLPHHYPPKNYCPLFPKRAHLPGRSKTKNRPLKLTMTLSFFDQFISPVYLGVPLMALALSLP